METTIQIKEKEIKESKNGKRYARYSTDQGWMSVFEKEVEDQLDKSCGLDESVVVEIAEVNNFKNIRKWVRIANPSDRKQQVLDGSNAIKVTEPKLNKDEVEANKQAGVSMRYAVDLCIAGKIELTEVVTHAKMILKGMKNLSKVALEYEGSSH